MEIWKVHKFCESASLAELQEKRKALCALLQQGKLKGTNAEPALKILEEYLELKRLFEPD